MRTLLSTFSNFLNLKFVVLKDPRGIQQNKTQNMGEKRDLKISEWKKQQVLHKGSRIKRTSDFFIRALKLKGHITEL